MSFTVYFPTWWNKNDCSDWLAARLNASMIHGGAWHSWMLRGNTGVFYGMSEAALRTAKRV